MLRTGAESALLESTWQALGHLSRLASPTFGLAGGHARASRRSQWSGEGARLIVRVRPGKRGAQVGLALAEERTKWAEAAQCEALARARLSPELNRSLH